MKYYNVSTIIRKVSNILNMPFSKKNYIITFDFLIKNHGGFIIDRTLERERIIRKACKW